jgi:hypothetical protein
LPRHSPPPFLLFFHSASPSISFSRSGLAGPGFPPLNLGEPGLPAINPFIAASRIAARAIGLPHALSPFAHVPSCLEPQHPSIALASHRLALRRCVCAIGISQRSGQPGPRFTPTKWVEGSGTRGVYLPSRSLGALSRGRREPRDRLCLPQPFLDLSRSGRAGAINSHLSQSRVASLNNARTNASRYASPVFPFSPSSASRLLCDCFGIGSLTASFW